MRVDRGHSRAVRLLPFAAAVLTCKRQAGLTGVRAAAVIQLVPRIAIEKMIMVAHLDIHL